MTDIVTTGPFAGRPQRAQGLRICRRGSKGVRDLRRRRSSRLRGEPERARRHLNERRTRASARWSPRGWRICGTEVRQEQQRELEAMLQTMRKPERIIRAGADEQRLRLVTRMNGYKPGWVRRRLPEIAAAPAAF
jgi:hypothetical protein